MLVKLLSCWDRRIIISGSRRLSSTAGFEQIFIAPDEPLAARRRRTLGRLVKKATENGKNVSANNGVMSINDVIVFTLEQGFVRSHNE